MVLRVGYGFREERLCLKSGLSLISPTRLQGLGGLGGVYIGLSLGGQASCRELSQQVPFMSKAYIL